MRLRIAVGLAQPECKQNGGQPVSFPVNQVIPGWQEAVQLLKEGGEATFFIPAKLAYGEQGAGDKIGPNSALIFDVKLVKVGGAEDMPAQADVQIEKVQ